MNGAAIVRAYNRRWFCDTMRQLEDEHKESLNEARGDSFQARTTGRTKPRRRLELHVLKIVSNRICRNFYQVHAFNATHKHTSRRGADGWTWDMKRASI